MCTRNRTFRREVKIDRVSPCCAPPDRKGDETEEKLKCILYEGIQRLLWRTKKCSRTTSYDYIFSLGLCCLQSLNNELQ